MLWSHGKKEKNRILGCFCCYRQGVGTCVTPGAITPPFPTACSKLVPEINMLMLPGSAWAPVALLCTDMHSQHLCCLFGCFLCAFSPHVCSCLGLACPRRSLWTSQCRMRPQLHLALKSVTPTCPCPGLTSPRAQPRQPEPQSVSHASCFPWSW